MFHTNTYVVENFGNAFVVDPGGNEGKICTLVESLNLKVEGILLTHAHFDHIAGVAPLKREIERRGLQTDEKGVKVYLHEDDLEKITSYKNMGFAVGVSVEPFDVDVLLRGGEKISVAGLDIEVLHTPGHSKGSVCYKTQDVIFVGDLIFVFSYGRTDFYDGNFAELENSIVNKIFKIEGDFKLYTGHGASTTLSFEKANNPICNDSIF